MRIRITGTPEECDAAVESLRLSFHVLHLSSWRRWDRHDKASRIGAVYVDAEFDEIRYPPLSIRFGTCCSCQAEGSLPMLCWGYGQYQGYCADCARRHIEQDLAGSVLKAERPELYAEYSKDIDRPMRHILYNSGGQWVHMVVPDDGTEGGDDE